MAAEPPAWLWRRWLAPAMAAAAALVCLLNTEPPWPSQHSGPSNPFWDGLVLTNPSFAAYIPGDSHSEQNRAVVDWPSKGRSASRFTPAAWGSWNTNRLMQ